MPEVLPPIPVGTIQAELNGKPTSFTIDARADTSRELIGLYEETFVISISGTENSSTNPGQIRIRITKKPASYIGPGTYTDLNKQIYAFIQFENNWRYEFTFEEPYTGKVTVSKIDSTVQGSFSGKLLRPYGSYGPDEPAPKSITLRNGRFNVRIR